jgi:ketosteroid isomerase-like protein
VAADYAEIVRGIYAGWERGNFAAGTERYTDETELVLRPEFPEAGTYRSPEGIAGYMRDLLASFERFTISCEGVQASGDRVAAAIHQQATGSGSGVPVDFRYFQVWTFDGEAIARMESIRDLADAIEAAGLSEWAPDRTGE